jgi:hypothetical protein
LIKEHSVAIGRRNATHGESPYSRQGASPEYRSWVAMKTRCLNPKSDAFDHYGGRGIKICRQWIESFEIFLADMGRRPTLTHTLDRYPDNDGDYEPGNCRWATKSEQRRNSRQKAQA